MDTKRPTPRYIIIKMPKVKDKDRILKAARENKLITYMGVTRKFAGWKKLCRLEGVGKKYSKSYKAGTYGQDWSTQQSYQLVLRGR